MKWFNPPVRDVPVYLEPDGHFIVVGTHKRETYNTYLKEGYNDPALNRLNAKIFTRRKWAQDAADRKNNCPETVADFEWTWTVEKLERN